MSFGLFYLISGLFSYQQVYFLCFKLLEYMQCKSAKNYTGMEAYGNIIRSLIVSGIFKPAFVYSHVSNIITDPLDCASS
jgi:hypothetical protein